MTDAGAPAGCYHRHETTRTIAPAQRRRCGHPIHAGVLQLELAPLQAQAAVERRQTAHTFNIFRVLGVDFNEVTTHSALLANLLRPQGSHAQGTLFLDRFLAFCTGTFPDALPVPVGPLLPDDWQVRAEVWTSEGNLDLVIASRRLGYLYVIENKIFAGEQPEQMERYARWLARQTHAAHRALFYLTPDGRQSLTSNGAPYFRLSYVDHIAASTTCSSRKTCRWRLTLPTIWKR